MRAVVATMLMLAVGITNALAGVVDNGPCDPVGSLDQYGHDCGGSKVKD